MFVSFGTIVNVNSWDRRELIIGMADLQNKHDTDSKCPFGLDTVDLRYCIECPKKWEKDHTMSGYPIYQCNYEVEGDIILFSQY